MRLTTSGAPFAALGTGAFAQADGSFLLSGYSDFHSLPNGNGNTTGVAGGTFPAPAGPLITSAVWLPDGSSLVAWNGSEVQQRAANGTFIGSPQFLADNVNSLGIDSSGNATAVGVLSNNGFSLNLYTRASAASAFTLTTTPIATSGTSAPMTFVGLVVDPDGAADVTWLAGATLYQATRAAGAQAFGTPAVLASNPVVGVTSTAPSFASNAAGRAVIVYYDGSGYSAAVRNPGGAFGPAADITGALTPSFANRAVGVAADGSAAALVRNAVANPGGCGTFYSLQTYRLGATASAWTAGPVVGGASGDSVSWLAPARSAVVSTPFHGTVASDARCCASSPPRICQEATPVAPFQTALTSVPPLPSATPIARRMPPARHAVRRTRLDLPTSRDRPRRGAVRSCPG